MTNLISSQNIEGAQEYHYLLPSWTLRQRSGRGCWWSFSYEGRTQYDFYAVKK